MVVHCLVYYMTCLLLDEPKALNLNVLNYGNKSLRLLVSLTEIICNIYFLKYLFHNLILLYIFTLKCMKLIHFLYNPFLGL